MAPSQRQEDADTHDAVRLIGAALIEHGDVIAARYRTTFIELSELYDQMLAFAQGVATAGYGDIGMGERIALEVPNFRLPALHQPAKDLTVKPFSRHGLASDTSGYTPYLRHEPDGRNVHETAALWRRFAIELASDPAAVVSKIPTGAEQIPGRLLRQRAISQPEPPEVPSEEPPRQDRKVGGITIHTRQHRKMSEAGILPGHPEGRWLGI